MAHWSPPDKTMSSRSGIYATVKRWESSAVTRVGPQESTLPALIDDNPGTVKAVQVEDNICLSGGSDGTVHLWDLRMVEDYEERLQQNEERVRKGLDGLHIEDEAVAKEEQARESADNEKEAGSKVVNDTPCIRVLEGHSKAVTALYYEDGCLVSLIPINARFR
jgi:WD40 repeat protein